MKYLDVPSSGSIADRTHSHNRAGQYTRNRRSPVQPIGTGRRAFIRSAFGAASAAWAGLTNEQQEAWIAFANSHPTTDSLGQTIILTGHQMFVACATALQNVGQALPTNPPATTETPDVSAATAVFDLSTGWAFTFPGTGASGDFLTYAFSPPLSAGRRFNRTFWQPLSPDGVFSGDDTEGAFTTAKYQAEFGTVTAGQVVFCKITPVNSGGWTGTPIVLRVVSVP
jgi:hypothetical protein